MRMASTKTAETAQAQAQAQVANAKRGERAARRTAARADALSVLPVCAEEKKNKELLEKELEAVRGELAAARRELAAINSASGAKRKACEIGGDDEAAERGPDEGRYGPTGRASRRSFYAYGEPQGRYASSFGYDSVPEVSAAEFEEAMARLPAPLVVGARREVLRGLAHPTSEDVAEMIYFPTDWGLGAELNDLVEGSSMRMVRGKMIHVVTGSAVPKFDAAMEAMDMVRFEFDVRWCSGADWAPEPFEEYVTERLWVWESSRVAVNLRALVEAAEAKAAALASPPCSPMYEPSAPCYGDA